MKITNDDIIKAIKEFDFSLEVTPEGRLISRVQGNNGVTVTTVIVIEPESDLVQMSSFVPLNVSKEKRTKALELINLIHGKSTWNFRYWLDLDDGSYATFAVYNTIAESFSPKEFNAIFAKCLLAADRIYPCLMALNYGDKEAKDAFESFYFKQVS